jgi:hypothetical protein
MDRNFTERDARNVNGLKEASDRFALAPKLGAAALEPSLIDAACFQAAAATLNREAR